MVETILINSRLSTGTYNSFLERIISLSNTGLSSYVCVSNVHMLIEAYRDPVFARIVNNAALCTPDGMPLVISLKLLYGIKQERIAGMDLLSDLLVEATHNNIPVYFYGGTKEMLDLTDRYIKKTYPTLVVAGLHSPPFRQLTEEEVLADIERINFSGARLLFVALGCPKQEKWMESMLGKVNMPMIGIGGALSVMIGLQNRAPLWMQQYSLEWLYRLIQEPKRLWKRYLITNTYFILLLFREFIKVRIFRNYY